MTASDTNYWVLTLNVMNLVDKTKYSKVYPDMNVSSSEFTMKLLDSTAVAIYLGKNFLIVNIADLSIRQRFVFSEPPKQ